MMDEHEEETMEEEGEEIQSSVDQGRRKEVNRNPSGHGGMKPLSTSPRDLWYAYREAGAPPPLERKDILNMGFKAEALNRSNSKLVLKQWVANHKAHCRLCRHHKGDKLSSGCYFSEMIVFLKRGFTLPFAPGEAERAPIHAAPISPRTDEERMLLLDRTKEDTWGARAKLQETPWAKKDVFIAPSFVARKRIFQHVDFREPRVVTCFNTTINPLLKVPSYQLVSVSDIVGEIKHTDMLGVLDLSSAFLQIPMAAECWRYLGVYVDPDDPTKVEVYKKLPFGLAVAPIIFKAVSSEVMAMARGRGLRAWSYFDDFPVLCDENTAGAEFDDFIALIRTLGLAYKKEKLCFPAKKGIILGMVVDIAKGVMSLKEEYIANLKSILGEVDNGPPTLSELRSIVGRLSHAAAVLPVGRLHLSGFYDALQVAKVIVSRRTRQGKKELGGIERIFPLGGRRSPVATVEDLRWWQKACVEKPPQVWATPLHCAQHLKRVHIESDASLDFSAAAIFERTVYLATREEWPEFFGSSTDAELLATLLPILCEPWRFKGCQVICHCDNAGTCYLLNSLRCRRGAVNTLLSFAMELQQKHGFIVVATWVPRERNKRADFWSRAVDLSQFPDLRGHDTLVLTSFIL